MNITQIRIPRNRAEGMSALTMRRGAEHRLVKWHYHRPRTAATADAYQHGPYDIHVKEPNTLHVEVWSGIPHLHVRSGQVTVTFHSAWGNVITVHEGAHAHIVVPNSDTKVTVLIEGGTYSLDVPEENRVRWPGKYIGVTSATQDAIDHAIGVLAAADRYSVKDNETGQWY